MKKKIVISIQPDYKHARNELHFEIQRKTRVQITKNGKAYNRKKMKKMNAYEY